MRKELRLTPKEIIKKLERKFPHKDKRGRRRAPGEMGEGLNFGEIARVAGVQRGHLSLIVNGKVNPGVRTLKRLASAMGVGVGEVVEWIEGMKGGVE